MGVHIPQGKSNKAFGKRFKVTRNGKVLGRKAGQNHFNAKARRAKQLNANRDVTLKIDRKNFNKFVGQS